MAKKTVAAKKRNVKVDAAGQLHVHSSFNNIIVCLANSEGQVISWSSRQDGLQRLEEEHSVCRPDGSAGLREDSLRSGSAQGEGLREGSGNGRESAIRTVHGAGIEVTDIIDVTPLPHNGCRPPKRRRV